MRWRIDAPCRPGRQTFRRIAAGRVPPGPAHGAYDPEAGFLLLETLIAFVIAALALVVLYRAAFDGAAAGAVASRETGALDRAQSRLAALRAYAPTHHYVRTGADGGGFRFRETANRLSAPSDAPLIAVRLTVTESWHGGHGVQLTTVVAAHAR